MKNIWISILVIAVVGLIVVYAVGNDSPSEDIVWPTGNITTIDTIEHNWGDINIKGGDVEHVFTLKNSSNEPLVIKTASTSCMCTSAYIDIPGESNSPTFSMNNNPPNWGRVVPAGSSFTVKVVFDPLAHGPDAIGPIQRSVYIVTSAAPDNILTYLNSNDDKGSVLELRTSGKVLYTDDFQQQQAKEYYPVIKGDFAFKENEYDFGIIKQSQGIVTHDFSFLYNGEEETKVTGTPGSCACTTATISDTDLSPGDEGVLTVEFDPNLHEEPDGRFFKTISVLTNPVSEENIEIKIWAEMDLDLGPEAYKQQEHID